MDLDYLSFAGIPVNFELQASTPLISLQAGVSHVSNLVAGLGRGGGHGYQRFCKLGLLTPQMPITPCC